MAKPLIKSLGVDRNMRTTHKLKLYIKSDIIVMIILLLILFTFLVVDRSIINARIVNINSFPVNDLEYLSESRYFEDLFDIDVPPDGKWNVYTFTNNDRFNSNLISNLQSDIHQFITQHDTNKNIKINLDRNMSYNQFIKIINILDNYKISRFNVNNSNIFIFRYPRLKFVKDTSYIQIHSFVVIKPLYPDWKNIVFNKNTK